MIRVLLTGAILVILGGMMVKRRQIKHAPTVERHSATRITGVVLDGKRVVKQQNGRA